MLTQHAPHRLVQHDHVQEKRSSCYRWHEHRGIRETLFDFLTGLLAVAVSQDRLVLTQQLEDGLTCRGELQDKSRDVIQPAQETSNLLLRARLWNFKNGLHFLGIYLYPFLAHDKSQQLPRRCTWLDLASVGISAAFQIAYAN